MNTKLKNAYGVLVRLLDLSWFKRKALVPIITTHNLKNLSWKQQQQQQTKNQFGGYFAANFNRTINLLH